MFERNYSAGTKAFEQKKHQEALHYFELARKEAERKDVPAVLGWIGVCLYHLEQYSDARNCFEAELELDPASEDTLRWWSSAVFKAAVAAFYEEDFRSALEGFQLLLERGEMPEVGTKSASEWSGLCYQMLGDYSKAVKSFEAALSRFPDTRRAKENLCYILATAPDAKLRNGQKALEIANELCSTSEKGEWVPLTLLAAAKAEIGDHESAVEVYERAISKMPLVEREKREKTLQDLRNKVPIRCSPEMDKKRLVKNAKQENR